MRVTSDMSSRIANEVGRCQEVVVHSVQSLEETMREQLLCLVTIGLVLAVSVNAADSDLSKIESVSWLTGKWQSAAGQSMACEEHWTAPAGGAMVGMFRLLN